MQCPPRERRRCPLRYCPRRVAHNRGKSSRSGRGTASPPLGLFIRGLRLCNTLLELDSRLLRSCSPGVDGVRHLSALELDCIACGVNAPFDLVLRLLKRVANGFRDLRHEILGLIADLASPSLQIPSRLLARPRSEQQRHPRTDRQAKQERSDARLFLLDDYVRFVIVPIVIRHSRFLLRLTLLDLALCRRAPCARTACRRRRRPAYGSARTVVMRAIRANQRRNLGAHILRRDPDYFRRPACVTAG